MNKTYRSIWNESTGTWMAAQENAKGRGKRSGKSAVVVALAAAGLVASIAAHAGGLDGGSAPGGASAEAIGSGAVANAANTVAVGSGATAALGYDVAIGSGAVTVAGANNTFGAIAIGGGATAYGDNGSSNGANIAIGYQSVAGNSGATTSQALAVGTNATATNWQSAALGFSSTSSGIYSTALGGSSSATADYTAAVGTYSQATASNASALGYNAHATTANSVALGANSVANSATLGTAGFTPAGGTAISAATAAGGEVSVGTSGNERRITRVAAGLNPTDAVNVSQLTSEDAKVNAVGTATAAALGGGSTFNTATGTLSAPSYVVGGTTVSNIGGAITNIDTRTTQNATSITNLTAQINSGVLGLVQQDPTTRNIKVAAATDGSIVDFTGTGGARKLTGVAAGAVGASSIDAVNGTQLYGVSQSVSNALGGGSSVSATGAVSAPSYALTNANSINGTSGADTDVGTAMTTIDTALGKLNTAIASAGGSGGIMYFHANSTLADSSASGANAVAIGGGALAQGSGAMAIGTGTGAIGNNSLAIGNGVQAQGQGGIAIGNVGTLSIDSASTNAVAIGNIAQVANSTNGVALGNFSYVDNAASGVAVGDSAYSTASDATALGANAQATTANSVALGSNSVANSTTLTTAGYNPGSGTLSAATAAGGEVSVGKAGAERRITNVAAGLNGTDAVNVSQLQSEDAKVGSVATSVANALGGGSTYNAATGAITPPSYVVGGTTVNNIAGALTNVDARVTSMSTDITNLTTQLNSGEVGLVQQDATTRNITVAAATDGTIVDFTGTAGARTLTGVAAGAVNSSSLDAVNGSQLYSVANSTAAALGGGSTVNSDGSISAPSYVIGGTTVNNIAGAMTNVDARVTAMSTDITNLTTQLNSGEVGLVQQDATTRNITVAAATDGTIVDFTGTAGARTLTGVAAGAVNSSSLDAVNGSQLYSVANSTAAALGGGSTVNSDGSISAPSYVIGGTTVSNIAGALTNVDARVTQNSSDITNLTTQLSSGEVGLVQQDPTTRNITVAAATDGSIVDFTGTAGQRVLTGVAAGAVNASSFDAVNGSQLYGVSQSVSNALGGGSSVNSDGSISAPSYVVGGTTVNNIGGAISNVDARTTQNTANIDNLTTQINSGTVGLVQQDPTTQNITVAANTGGSLVDVSGTAGPRVITGVAAGAVNASSTDAINGSQLYNVSNSMAGALGGGSTVNADGTISAPTYVVGGTTVNNVGGAISNIDARTTQNTADIQSINNGLNSGTIGMVQQDQTTRNITVAAATDGSVVDFTGTAGTRKLTGVSAGDVNASSTDAVNGSQLYTSNASIASAIGGGSTVNSDGTISAPTFNVGGTTVNSIGDAVTNLDTRVTQNSSDINSINNTLNEITTGNAGIKYFHSNSDLADSQATGANAVAIGGNAKATADNSVALGANSVADRANTVSVGAKGSERQVTNVAAGTEGTDAVNVDQLNQTVANAMGTMPAGMTSKSYTDQQINMMQNTVNQVAKNAYAGVAAAMAMPNMTPSQPGNTVVAAGAGTYKGGSAAGVGATYRSRDGKWLVNGAVSVTSTGDAGVRAQVGYEF